MHEHLKRRHVGPLNFETRLSETVCLLLSLLDGTARAKATEGSWLYHDPISLS